MGGIYVTSWEKEFYEWIESEEMWELSNSQIPTFKKGTAPDTMLMALGPYLPEGQLPLDALEAEETALNHAYANHNVDNFYN